MFKIGLLVVDSHAMFKAKEKMDEMKKEVEEKRQKKTKEKVEKRSRRQLLLSISG